MGVTPDDDAAVPTLGSVACVADDAMRVLTIEMENDLTSEGDWGDEVMSWDLSIMNPTGVSGVVDEMLGCVPTV
jgi:hypothetical protein